jgi:hypothetical protein
LALQEVLKREEGKEEDDREDKRKMKRKEKMKTIGNCLEGGTRMGKKE